MNRQQSLIRRPGEPFDGWTWKNEEALQECLEEGKAHETWEYQRRARKLGKP